MILGGGWAKVKERLEGGSPSSRRAARRRHELPDAGLPERPGRPGRGPAASDVERRLPAPAGAGRPPAPEVARTEAAGMEGFLTEGVRTEGFGTEGLQTEGLRQEGFGSEGVGSEGVPREGLRPTVAPSALRSSLQRSAGGDAGGTARAPTGADAGPAVDPGEAAALLSTREGLARAVLLAEVLGKPRALRPYGR